MLLIAHRNSFSPNLILIFYKENVGLKEGIKNEEILSILKLIKKNKLKEYNLADELYNSEKIMHRVYEGAYPSRYNASSPHLITKIKDINCKFIEKLNSVYLLDCD